MFGRSTFTMEFNPAEDKTSFFQDMEGDEECVPIADAKQSYLDLVELGQHGVIPVGAMVKIFQAFADTQGGGNHVAVLLAGTVVCKAVVFGRC